MFPNKVVSVPISECRTTAIVLPVSFFANFPFQKSGCVGGAVLFNILYLKMIMVVVVMQ